MADTIHERIKLLVDKLAEGKNTIFAANLGVSEANIRSYIRGVVPKADILSKIVSYYDVSAEWLLTGRGEMLSSEVSAPPPTAQNPAQHDALVGRLLEKITEQAEEIGRLKAQIDELERRRGDDASDATSSKSALVG